MLKYLVAIAMIPLPAYAQCIGSSCPLPSGGIQRYFAPRPQQQQQRQRPPNEPLKFPGWMCEVEGGLGFHVGGGLVATCFHGSAKEVVYQGKTYPAYYIAGQRSGDVAILKTDIQFQETVRVCATSPQPGTVIYWQGGSGRVQRVDTDSLYVDCMYRLGDSGCAVWTRDGVVSIVSSVSPYGSIGVNAETLTQCIAEAKKIISGSNLVPLPQPQPTDQKPDPMGPTLQDIMTRLDDLTSKVETGQATSQATTKVDPSTIPAPSDDTESETGTTTAATANTTATPTPTTETPTPTTEETPGDQQPSNSAPWIPIDPLYLLLATAAGVTGLGVPSIAIWGATIATRTLWKRRKEKRRRRSQVTDAATAEPTQRTAQPEPVVTPTATEAPTTEPTTTELPGGNSAIFQGQRDTTEAEQFLRLRNLEGREPILDALVGAITLDRLEETIDSSASDNEQKKQAIDLYDYIHKTVNRLAPLAISTATV